MQIYKLKVAYNQTKNRSIPLSVSTAMFLGVLGMCQVSTLLGESDKVGEDHPPKAHVVQRLDGARLNVLGMVTVESPLYRTLGRIHRQHRL